MKSLKINSTTFSPELKAEIIARLPLIGNQLEQSQVSTISRETISQIQSILIKGISFEENFFLDCEKYKQAKTALSKDMQDFLDTVEIYISLGGKFLDALNQSTSEDSIVETVEEYVRKLAEVGQTAPIKVISKALKIVKGKEVQLKFETLEKLLFGLQNLPENVLGQLLELTLRKTPAGYEKILPYCTACPSLNGLHFRYIGEILERIPSIPQRVGAFMEFLKMPRTNLSSKNGFELFTLNSLHITISKMQSGITQEEKRYINERLKELQVLQAEEDLFAIERVDTKNQIILWKKSKNKKAIVVQEAPKNENLPTQPERTESEQGTQKRKKKKQRPIEEEVVQEVSPLDIFASEIYEIVNLDSISNVDVQGKLKTQLQVFLETKGPEILKNYEVKQAFLEELKITQTAGIIRFFKDLNKLNNKELIKRFTKK